MSPRGRTVTALSILRILSARTLSAQGAGLWGRVPVLPMMEIGATAGFYLRNQGVPVFGLNGVFSGSEDDRSHGRDERIGVVAFNEGLEFARGG